MSDTIPQKPRVIALIPARSGSKRIPNKNIKMLGGHPLIAYAIKTALDSGIFERVIVSTDSQDIADIAIKYGAEVPFLRPDEYAGDHSPDIEWIRHLLTELGKSGELAQAFSILRPTSPFRTADTIRQAWNAFLSDPSVHSLRAVELCKQHPAKMWVVSGNRMKPVMERPEKDQTPWHSMQYQSLPQVYAQNASLEIAWSWVPLNLGTIAGQEIMPFISQSHEGFDINRPEDWILAEHMLREGTIKLPQI